MKEARTWDFHTPTVQARGVIPSGAEHLHDHLRQFTAFRATIHVRTPTSLLVSFSGKRAEAVWLPKCEVRIINGWLVLTDQFIVDRRLVWVYDE